MLKHTEMFLLLKIRENQSKVRPPAPYHENYSS